MATVQPFRGLRFSATAAPDVGQVLCPPYDVIDAADDARLRAQHPLNVVRVELTTASVSGGPEGRYEEAASTLRDWRRQGALVREDRPAFYLHEATFPLGGGQRTRRELIAAVGVEPWERRAVLPHERTYPRAKADRLRLLATTQTNLSPILSFFQRDRQRSHQHGADAVDAAWQWAGERPPAAAGTDSEGVGHRLWVLTDSALVEGLQAYFVDRPVFIADGHHRYETALNYLEDQRQQAGSELPADHPARFVMMHLIAEDDPGLVILPLHRLVAGLGTVDIPGLVSDLAGEFQVETRAVQTGAALDAALSDLQARGEQGQALALVTSEVADLALLTRPASAPSPAALPSDRDASWRALDVVLLDYTIVRPLLAARQLHAEDAISYTRNAQDAVQRVRSGEVDLAVLVNPTRVEQVAAVALAGERMPEKSTYFYPKAPTGLVFRPLE
ncbi:MAG: DUF1015 domain-containing protein [Chloroflexota bacterium]